ncbi:MAG: hypothetical protein QE493_03520 [Verrucomicrobiae bacterium]|nr:hypothetical protein [Verrucomicrobiae bacterium]
MDAALTRIFHTNLLRKPVSQMDAALDSYFDLDSIYSYSPASKYSLALPHQPSRLPRHDQYEICGLSSKSSSRSGRIQPDPESSSALLYPPLWSLRLD